MKLYRLFLTLSRGKQIAIGVCIVHLLAIFSLTIHHLATGRFRKPRPMVVRTVQAAPERKIQSVKQIETPKTVANKPAPEKPKPAAKKQEPPKTVAAAKKPSPKPVEKPVEKEAPPSLETVSKKRPALIVPSKIESKKAPVEIKEEPTYGEYLVAYLQSALDLPEYGEVRAKIEIDRFGKLIHCEIVEAKSKKNGEFLKNQLPDLTFPCLNDFGIVDATHIFTITFRNDDETR